jgi:Fe-S cluster biogenesis protein NfuA/nitrite reductase/ring-hydroxylating ferredoxin subunit
MDTAGADPGAISGTDELVQRIQDLQERLDAAGDSTTREVADQLVSAVVQMYGAGLERIVELLVRMQGPTHPDGRQIADALSEDELVSALLLIHDLHPVPLADRVRAALDSVRPYMESHGGNVELLSIEGGVATIHLRGSCSDCSASAVTLELAIKQALEEVAPDLEGLEVLGIAAQTAGHQSSPALPMVSGSMGGWGSPTGMELPIVMAGPGGSDSSHPSWVEVQSVSGLADGALAAVSVAGADLVVANVDGTLLAYRDCCANCGAPLHQGLLSAGALACPECDRSFFLPRAGRSLDDEHMQLEPVPLLRDEGRVKVALSQ